MRRAILQLAGLILLGTLPLIAQASPAEVPPPHAPSKPASHPHRKPKPDPVIPVPPPRSIPAFTPEQLPPQPPRVSYQNGRLTVDSQNSTLGDIVTAIRRQTGMRMELISGSPTENPPNANERVATHLSGSAREVLADLLDGANVGYIMVSSPDRPDSVKTVVLTTNPQNQVTQAAARPQPPVPPPPPEPEEEPQPEPQAEIHPVPEQGDQPQPAPPGQPGQPNPFVGGQQPRFGQPGQPPVQIPPQNADQTQGPQGQPQPPRSPAELLQQLQQMRNAQAQGNQTPSDSSAPQQ